MRKTSKSRSDRGRARSSSPKYRRIHKNRGSPTRSSSSTSYDTIERPGTPGRRVRFPDTKKPVDRSRDRRESGTPDSGDLRRVIDTRREKSTPTSSKKSTRKPRPSTVRRNKVKAVVHATKRAAVDTFDHIDKAFKNTVGANKENTKSTDDCIKRLEDFKIEHFGPLDSPKLLKNQLRAERHRSWGLYSELCLVKGVLGGVLQQQGVRALLDDQLEIETVYQIDDGSHAARSDLSAITFARLPETKSKNLMLKKMANALLTGDKLMMLNPAEMTYEEYTAEYLKFEKGADAWV